MKKKFLIFACLVTLLTWAQNPKNDWQSANLKNKVKSAGLIEYVPNEKGELIQQGQNFSAQFNKKGYITQMQIKQGNEFTQLQVDFSKNGYPSKTTFYNEKGEVTFYNQQQSDDKGRILSEKGYTDSDYEAIKTIFTYDDNGFLTEKKIYQLGSYGFKIVYINDVKGNPVEEKNYNSKQELDYRIVNTYDKYGNRIQAIAYNANNEIFEHYTYVYDKHNNLIQEDSFSSEGIPIYKKTYVYQYDKKNNWTKKIEYTDGKKSMVTEQFVEYF